MRLYLYTIALLSVLISCNNKMTDYNTAIENCIQNRPETKQAGNPDSLIFWRPNPDCLIGSRCPVFEGKTINGRTINNDVLKGHLNIINFWFTSCPPCIAEIPAFNYLVDKYKNRNINFISFCNENEKDIREFLESREFKFEVIPNGEPVYRKIFKTHWGYPFTLVVDEKGGIIKAFSGGRTEEEQAFKKVVGMLEPLILENS